ncbi:MAG TPA: hypothetical protein VET27_22685 [Mycobacterium sp.]|nr:hypothetical protein [Mycobacterium sp.]
MNDTSSRKILGGLRFVVGALSLTSPRLTARVFGVDPERAHGWVTRLFGSRELVLAGSLLTADGEQLTTVARLGVIIDTVDAASTFVEFARGRVSTYSLVSGGVGALLFAALGTDVVCRSGRPSLG